MEIITNIPKYSDGEVNAAFMREIKLGFHRERVNEGIRVKNASAYAQSFKDSKEVPGLGRHVAAMPARDYFRLVQKYGHQEVHSDDFIRYFQKKMPELTSHKV